MCLPCWESNPNLLHPPVTRSAVPGCAVRACMWTVSSAVGAQGLRAGLSVSFYEKLPDRLPEACSFLPAGSSPAQDGPRPLWLFPTLAVLVGAWPHLRRWSGLLMAREASGSLAARTAARSAHLPCPPPNWCGVRCCVLRVIYVLETRPRWLSGWLFLPVWCLFLVLERVFHRARFWFE